MTDYRALTRATAREVGIDEVIFERQIAVESIDFNVDVIECRRSSPAGAQGIAQIMRASHPNVDPCDPPTALLYAARWMKQLIGQYGNWRLALAAYNAGPGNVAKHGGVPPFEETQNYLTKILGAGWPEPGGTAVPAPAYDPTYPPVIQPGDWQCSIGTTSWMLHSIGRRPAWRWIEDTMVAEGYVTERRGLMDASGRGIVAFLDEYYPEYKDLTNFDSVTTWDEIAAMAGTRPLGLGLRRWADDGHWSAVRGIADGALHLANPAGTGPKYGQTWINRDFFEARGPASSVWIKVASTPAADPQSEAWVTLPRVGAVGPGIYKEIRRLGWTPLELPGEPGEHPTGDPLVWCREGGVFWSVAEGRAKAFRWEAVQGG